MGGPFSWTITTGVNPVVGEFQVLRDDARALTEGGPSPVDLVIGDGEREQTFSGLYVVGEYPAENENESVVRVADRRWWWKRQHILRRYNMRRRVGTKRVDEGGGVRERATYADDVGYAPFSLIAGQTPWQPIAVLDDVLREAFTSEPSPGGYEIRGLGRVADLLPIESLELDDRADSAIERVISYIPEAAIMVDASGDVVVFSAADGSEESVIEQLPGEVVGGGHLTRIDYSRVRPESIVVGFSREVEVRFNAQELALGSTTDRGTEGRYMDNVLPVPDYELELTDGRKVTRGTWITFDEALNAWNDQGVPGIGEITYDIIQRALVPNMDLWAGIQLAGERDPDNDWASRVAAIQAHYRRTYRINRRWLDRIYQLSAYRVSTVDTATGTRAPSPVYSDFAIQPSQRMLFAQAAAGRDQSFYINVLGIDQPGSVNTVEITNLTKPAPATVQIVDMDQGIIAVDWQVAPERSYDLVLPSMVELVGVATSPGQKPIIPGPTGDIADRTRPITTDSVGPGFRGTKLTSNHRLVTILTAIPAAPNNDGQLHRLTIEPDAVAQLLSDNLASGLEQANGPSMEIRIGAGIETARVAWDDGFASVIEQVFGVSGGGAIDAPPVGADVLNPITVNAGEQGERPTQIEREASLPSIAIGAAASVYASFRDRWQGSASFPFTPGIEPTGNIESVEYRVSTEGAVTTSMTLPEEPVVQIDMESFMPAATRSILFRLANPGRAP